MGPTRLPMMKIAFAWTSRREARSMIAETKSMSPRGSEMERKVARLMNSVRSCHSTMNDTAFQGGPHSALESVVFNQDSGPRQKAPVCGQRAGCRHTTTPPDEPYTLS